MWTILLLITGFLLSGCYSVFDPAPYNPTQDTALLQSHQLTPQTISVVGSYRTEDTNKLLIDSANKLQALADGYATARDDTMRQELIFDVPILGLGIATVASSIFKGSHDQVLALGLGAAGVVGTRLYFNPQGKIVAYNSAALALSCAASVASALSTIDDGTGKNKAAALAKAIDLANSQVATSAATLKANLLISLAQAQNALTDLNTALATLEAAPVKLQIFENQVIRNTTSKIVTGSQNVDAALAEIRAATSTSTSKPPNKALPAAQEVTRTNPQDLQQLAADAEAYAQAIKDAWSLAACTAT